MKNKYNTLSLAARASIWAFIASVAQKGIAILSTPLFTRILSPEDYGQFALYQSWHDIFIIFTSLNVFNYATYSAMKEFKDKDGFISTAQTLVTFLTLICMAVYVIVHLFLGDVIGFSLPIVILLFIDLLFFAVYSLWSAKERYDYKYKVLTILSLLIGFTGPIFSLVLIKYLPNKGLGRIYGVELINIIVGLIIYISNYKKSKDLFNRKYIKFIFVYCLPLIPHFLSSQILSRLDRIMINDMCSSAEAGIYSLAYSLSTLMIIINEAILKSYTPWTYKTIKEEKNLTGLKKNTNILILTVAFVNLLLILFAPEAIKIFAPSEYYESIYIIPAVSASVYYMFLFNIFANIEYYYSETKYVAFASFSAALINVILNIIFIKKYGYIAAGYTTLISYIIYSIGHYIFMKRVLKKHNVVKEYYDNKLIIIISFLFTIMSLAIIPLYKFRLFRYVLIMLIFGILLYNKNRLLKLIKEK